MNRKFRKYLDFVKIELEYLEEELECMLSDTSKKNIDGEITDYVSRENIGLLKREIAGIKTIVSSLDKIVLDDYKTFIDMLTDIEQRFEIKLKNNDIPESCNIFLKRKLDKVAAYFKNEEKNDKKY